MKLQATAPIKVFIDKKHYGNTDTKFTDVGKIPEHKREDVSWKGCYYTISPQEIFYFDRSNDWDASYFTLENGAEFRIGCGDFMSFVKRNSVNIV